MGGSVGEGKYLFWGNLVTVEGIGKTPATVHSDFYAILPNVLMF